MSEVISDAKHRLEVQKRAYAKNLVVVRKGIAQFRSHQLDMGFNLY